MNKIVLGLLAHVDAGKTTLAEAMLHAAGARKTPGRVDHGSTLLDSHQLERERGITIFSSQAPLSIGSLQATLLDTPGHVDFSPEMERVLQVLDYGILVISGADGVQAHTHTLWQLLKLYQIPLFIFITKMDLARNTPEDLMAQLQQELDPGCTDFRAQAASQRQEALALCREDLLEQYIQTGQVEPKEVAGLIASRKIFPCYFGSGLHQQGVDSFLQAIAQYAQPPVYPDVFGAKVFKITHDSKGQRLTHLKLTGGILRVRDTLATPAGEEKVSQLRVYAGERFTAPEQLEAGSVCAIPNLTGTQNGQGLGREALSTPPVLSPMLCYAITLPQGCTVQEALPKLRQLEEEEPQLHLRWDSHLRQLQVGLMGAVQAEILKALIQQRFGWVIGLDQGRVMHKETIAAPVEGVGHYEPLRHYAEVHLLLEPLPRNSGLVFAADCPEDRLDRSWQRLILTHLAEKEHIGVLTGSPITDMKLTLVSGKAHPKHTEGGDFRQATYRAVRQGLMQAQTVLLEPYYRFRLEVPPAQVGRAIADIKLRQGEVSPPEPLGAMTLLEGRCPVASLMDYAQEVAAYTRGLGRLTLTPDGYDLCRDPAQVQSRYAYDPETDAQNPADSVFCSHGSGVTVKWDQVPRHMHLESCMAKAAPAPSRRPTPISEQELNAILAKLFGPEKRPPQARSQGKATLAPQKLPAPAATGPELLLVDGYNLIFALDDLNALAKEDLAQARDVLMGWLCSYSAYKSCQTTLVFDGYKAPGNPGERFTYHNIQVVYTKTGQTADLYLEQLVTGLDKRQRVRVITSDGLIQLAAVRTGMLRQSAREFGRELAQVEQELRPYLHQPNGPAGTTIGEHIHAKEEGS